MNIVSKIVKIGILDAVLPKGSLSVSLQSSYKNIYVFTKHPILRIKRINEREYDGKKT